MKNLIIGLLTLTSVSAFAATGKCQKAAEVWALKDAGRGTTLFHTTVKNRDGSYEVYTAKNEVDTDYRVGTKLSEDGNSCKVISHKIVDQQSG